jgi:hypothetical protein
MCSNPIVLHTHNRPAFGDGDLSGFVSARSDSRALGLDARKPKVLKTEVRSKKAELRNSGSIQRITHGGDEFFVVERLHEKRDWANGHGRGARGQIFTRSDDDHLCTR